MDRFAPDFDDEPTLEIPDFRARAQLIIHLLFGEDINHKEYGQKLEIVEIELKRIYQDGASNSKLEYEGRLLALHARLERTLRRTIRPNKPTNPGIGLPSIPAPPPVPKEAPPIPKGLFDERDNVYWDVEIDIDLDE
jgi:hypothetical protein